MNHYGRRRPHESISKQLSQLYEPNSRRVHAVTEPGRARTIVEDVAQVGITLAAGNGSTIHPEGGVMNLYDIFLRDRLPKAGPACAGIELRLRAE